MKKIFSILSLMTVLFSTFAPSFTYANKVEDLAKEILSDTLIDSMNMFENSHWVTSLQQSQEAVNLFWDQEEDQINTNEEADPKIEYDNENKLITITSEKYNHSITLKDKNVWAENVWDYWDYLSFSTTICPTWFHTPSKIEWENLILLYSLIKNNESDFATDFKLPYAWAKQNWNFLGSTVSNLWYYWSSTDWTGWDYNWFYTLIKKEDWTIQTDKYYPKWMFSLTIRCFKDNNEKIKLVKFNPNWWAFSGMRENETKIIKYTYNWDEIIPINNIQIPDRETEDKSQQSWWMFAWWYTTAENQTEEFDISNPQTTTAYAKWLPFNDLDLSIIWLTGVVIMDRNMWAEAYLNEWWKTANDWYWYYYQRWNNYWFKNDENTRPANSWTDLISNTSSNPWWPNNYYYSNKFIKREYQWPYRWDNENNLNLWWGQNPKNSDIDKKWPCPKWYHVPDVEEWNTLKTSLNNIKATECVWDISQIWKCFSVKLKMPFAGYRSDSNAYVISQSNGARYWSSTPSSDGNKAYNIWLGNTYVSTPDNDNRKAGESVRCFKNIEDKTITISAENWEGNKEVNARWRENIWDYLKNVSYKWYKLIWLYYDSDYQNVINKSDKVLDNKTIYAKLEKNPWYKFDANWWYFDNNKEQNNKTIKYEYEELKKISSTPNIDETGKKNWWYDTNYEWDILTDVVSLEWVEQLHIKVTYWWEWPYDYLIMWKGNHPEYKDNINSHISEAIKWKKFSVKDEDWDTITEEFDVEWDTITFIFVYDGGDTYNNYWYYAVITTTKDYVYTTEDTINQPTKDLYTFSWWYETWELTPFDFTWREVNQDRTFYAKWNPYHYTIKFNLNWWTWEIEDIYAAYWEETALPKVIREWYEFKWWQSEDWVLYNNNVIPEWTWVTTVNWATVILTAQWKLIPAESEKQIAASAWGWRTITSTNQEPKVTEQEHNSADIEKIEVKKITTWTTQVTGTQSVEKQINKIQWRSLSRWEVAVMTNILLDVYPQLTENRELNEVSEACENYADEQNFTKDEKKAITRLCKLSIMWIHADNNKPLDEFLVNERTKNDEFSKVINRSISTYNEKDFSTIKDALKKLENNEENVEFWTVYNVFMSIKNIFN